MQFGHEQPDVYRLSIDYVTWVYSFLKDLGGVDRHTRDHLLRASQSVPLNIAGGNGKDKGTNADHRSRLGNGMCGDSRMFIGLQGTQHPQNTAGKAMLSCMVSMLIKLGRRKPRIERGLALLHAKIEIDICLQKLHAMTLDIGVEYMGLTPTAILTY